MTIDGWECEELWPGTHWRMRTAKRGNIEIDADDDGLSVSENYLGYQGGTGSYFASANVITWLVGAVR